MIEMMKKSLHVGLGLAALTKETVERVAKELAKSAKMSEDEGRKLAEYLQDESQKARDNLMATVDRMVESALSRLPAIKKIEELEKRVAELEKACGKTPAAPTADPGTQA